jgi:hypothetical protein
MGLMFACQSISVSCARVAADSKAQSARDTKRKIKRSRMSLMSGPSRLVTHMNRFESKFPNLRICVTSCDSISSFYEV